MRSADDALRQTKESKDAAKTKAMAEIDSFQHNSEEHEMFGIFQHIDERVATATQRGGSATDVGVPNILGRQWSHRKLDRVTSLLRDLGYFVDLSMSSNPENERMFLEWDPSKKTEED